MATREVVKPIELVAIGAVISYSNWDIRRRFRVSENIAKTKMKWQINIKEKTRRKVQGRRKKENIEIAHNFKLVHDMTYTLVIYFLHWR